MPFLVIPILLLLFLAASDDHWTPQRVPTAGAVPFILYYQQFLRANPFKIESEPKTPEGKEENRRRHQRAAELYAEMAKVAETLAKSGDLLPAAPANIERKESQLIVGSWNLYPNVPINAADLRQEALNMRFRALYSETGLDSAKISAMYVFADGLEKDAENDADLMPLFQGLKRATAVRALSFVYHPITEHVEKSGKPLPSEPELGEKLSVAVQWFAPFVQKYPNEKNMERVDLFLNTVQLFRTHYPDSERPAEMEEQFRSVFIAIQNQQVEPIVKEYAEIYEGVLRRQELLGKPMPIWGADLQGKPLDEKTLEGKVVLLDFWATWCGPCIAEFPHLKLLYQKYKDKGFEIVGYSVDSDKEKLHDFLERNPLPWIMLSRESSEQLDLPLLSRHYGAKALPVVLLRDRTGKAIMFDARGGKLDDMMEALFE